MNILSLGITSFAGTSQSTVDFKPGLNVILGPNEAGKSTIFHAIEHMCLTPTKLSPTLFRKTLGVYVPAGGADTMKVSMRFSASGIEYELEKVWGAASGVELRLTDGSLISDDSAVTERLRGLLPASPAVMRSVLMTYQTGLEHILSDLATATEPLFELRELLRRALQGTDGIPVDKFRAMVVEQIDEYYRRWDKRSEAPEQGRGAANPWKQNRGTIVDAWYIMTDLTERRQKILAAEDELAASSGRLLTAAGELSDLEGFLGRHRGAADAALVHEKNELQLEKLQNSETLHAKVYDQWPKTAERLAEVSTLTERGKEKVSSLTEERDATLASKAEHDRLKETVFRLARANEYARELKIAEDTKNKLPPVTGEYVDGIEKLFSEAEAVRRELQAGSVHLRFTARADIQLEVQKNLQSPERLDVSKGESVSLRTDGFLSLQHPDWSLVAQPGETDIDLLTTRCDELSGMLNAELERFELASISDARAPCAAYRKAVDDVQMKERLLREVLADDTIETLEAELPAAVGETSGRPYERIVEELATAKQALGSLESESIVLAERLREYEETFGERDTVLDLLLTDREARQAIVADAAGAPPLPEGYSDWQEFSRIFVQKQALREAVLAKKHGLETQVAALEAAMPEESAEEVALELEQAVKRFASVRQEAVAMEKIFEKTEMLLSGTTDDIVSSLKDSFETYFSEVTGERYGESRFENDLPSGVVRADGLLLLYHQLSAGTRDGFSLALRLAMAEYFLESSGGFLILDDPLVDMDNGRRAAAASAMMSFSENSQTIIFTCHPEHAALFPVSSVIRLE